MGDRGGGGGGSTGWLYSMLLLELLAKSGLCFSLGKLLGTRPGTEGSLRSRLLIRSSEMGIDMKSCEASKIS